MTALIIIVCIYVVLFLSHLYEKRNAQDADDDDDKF